MTLRAPFAGRRDRSDEGTRGRPSGGPRGTASHRLCAPNFRRAGAAAGLAGRRLHRREQTERAAPGASFTVRGTVRGTAKRAKSPRSSPSWPCSERGCARLLNAAAALDRRRRHPQRGRLQAPSRGASREKRAPGADRRGTLPAAPAAGGIPARQGGCRCLQQRLGWEPPAPRTRRTPASGPPS